MKSLTCLASALLAVAGLAVAQSSAVQPPAGPGAPVMRSTGNPAKDNLLKMQAPLTQDFNENRLEDVVKYIAEKTGAQIEVMWRTDRTEGFDKDTLVTLSFNGLSAMTVLEKVLAILAADQGAETTWQFTEYGAMQIGLKSEFNKVRRVEIYDINDLLFDLPIYDEAPQIDLNQVIQSGGGGRGGGGGGRSPFNQTNSNRQGRADEREREREERARNIVSILTSFAEPTQWIDGGGDVPSPRYFQGHIIVDAPDYMHRAVNGYRWWPRINSASSTPGRRYVMVTPETGISRIAGIRNVPVVGTAGGATSPGGGG